MNTAFNNYDKSLYEVEKDIWSFADMEENTPYTFTGYIGDKYMSISTGYFIHHPEKGSGYIDCMGEFTPLKENSIIAIKILRRKETANDEEIEKYRNQVDAASTWDKNEILRYIFDHCYAYAEHLNENTSATIEFKNRRDKEMTYLRTIAIDISLYGKESFPVNIVAFVKQVTGIKGAL